MTIWFLLENQTVTVSAPPKVIRPTGGTLDSEIPPSNTLTEVRVNGIGNCTATVALLGSNDTVQQLMPGGAGAWSTITSITITGTSSDITPGVGSIVNTAAWRHYGMTCSAVSGTQAAVTAKMSS